MYTAVLENLERDLWEFIDVMGRQAELRDRLGIPDLTIRQAGHFLVINFDGREITIGALATDEQIEAEIRRFQPPPLPEKSSMGSITGASDLIGTIKDRINAAKGKIAQVTANTDSALAKLNDAADRGDRIAKQIEAEADDLNSQLGQFTNE